MRLHFTIRDLLWLTAVVALAVAWWIDHRHMADDSDARTKLAIDATKQLRADLNAANSRAGAFEALLERSRQVEPTNDRPRIPIDNMPIMPPPAKNPIPRYEPQ